MTLSSVPTPDITFLVVQLVFGAIIAFAMEFSEFMVLSKTSSLTLSISGIFKVCFAVLQFLFKCLLYHRLDPF